MKKIILVVIVLLSMITLSACKETSNEEYYTKEEVNAMIEDIETNNVCDVTYSNYTEAELNIIISQLQQRIEDIDRE